MPDGLHYLGMVLITSLVMQVSLAMLNEILYTVVGRAFIV